MYFIWNPSSQTQEGPLDRDQFRARTLDFTGEEYVCRLGDSSWTLWPEAKDIQSEIKVPLEPAPASPVEALPPSSEKAKEAEPSPLPSKQVEDQPVRVQVEGLGDLTKALSESQRQQSEIIGAIREILTDPNRRENGQAQLLALASEQLGRQQTSLDILARHLAEAHAEIKTLLGGLAQSSEIGSIKILLEKQREQLAEIKTGQNTENNHHTETSYQNGTGTTDKLLNEWQNISAQLVEARRTDEKRMDHWQSHVEELLETIISSLVDLRSGIQENLGSQETGVVEALTQMRKTMDHLADVLKEFGVQEPVASAEGN